LEENAHFCHKCGTPVVILSSAPSSAKPTKQMEKSPYLIPLLILLAIVITAVIVGAFLLWTISVNSNQANGSNQTNGNELSFNFHDTMAKVNVIAQNLIGETIHLTTYAAGLQQTNHQLVSA
jgi:flagellar basal body-associated protein FliL